MFTPLTRSYFLKAIAWCRKYGLRILLDFHALPGSQNGWNHSGKAGSVNFIYGVMGIANAQRTLEYLRTMAEYISEDGIKQVVPMCVPVRFKGFTDASLSLVNEIQASVVGIQVLSEL